MSVVCRSHHPDQPATLHVFFWEKNRELSPEKRIPIVRLSLVLVLSVGDRGMMTGIHATSKSI